LANVIAASMSTTGRRDEAAPWVEIAMTAAEDAASWDALTRAFNVKGILLWEQGRRVEATVLMKAALDLGLEHDLGVRTIVQYGNLALNALDHDLVESLDLATKALDAAVRVGDRRMGAFAYGTRQAALLHLGRWDEMMSGGDEWMEYEGTITWRSTLSFPLICAGSWRGGDVSELLDSLPGEVSDPATKVVIAAGRAVAAHGRGDTETAFAEASEAVETGIALNDSEEFLVLLPIFLDSALASGRLAEASATVDELSQRPAGRTSAAIKAQLARFSARIAAARGEHDSVDRAFVEAVRLFSQYGAPFWTAWTLLEHAEWAAAQGRRDQAAELAARSAGMFENLDATPFVERARAAAGALNHDSVDA
jgi:tetratricopeptide (TPR) repeat protein